MDTLVKEMMQLALDQETTIERQKGLLRADNERHAKQVEQYYEVERKVKSLLEERDRAVLLGNGVAAKLRDKIAFCDQQAATIREMAAEALRLRGQLEEKDAKLGEHHQTILRLSERLEQIERQLSARGIVLGELLLEGEGEADG